MLLDTLFGRHALRAMALFVLGQLAVAPSSGVAQEPDGMGAPLGLDRWEPRSAGMHHVPGVVLGGWTLSGHGHSTSIYIDEGGVRGEDGLYNLSMLRGRATRGVAGGTLQLRVGVSAEPAMGARGYPHLLQTGESADGETPLFDRQHPHDFFTELALAYELPVDSTFSLFVYAAGVGDPAFGPGPYMQRTSARDLPRAPVSHHLFDGAHITSGVLTLGLVSSGRVKLEGSLYNGREPDERRWDLEGLRLDSYALRLTALAGRDWSFQGSLAQVTSPERLHPGIDVTRLSLSTTYNRQVGSGSWQTTFAFGRSKTARTTIPVDEARARFSAPVLEHYLSLVESSGVPEDSVLLYFPVRTQEALLVESGYRRGAFAVAIRAERVTKPELFAPTDARHSQLFEVSKIEVGVGVDVLTASFGSLSVGAMGSLSIVPEALQAEYGSRPPGWGLYTRVRLE